MNAIADGRLRPLGAIRVIVASLASAPSAWTSVASACSLSRYAPTISTRPRSRAAKCRYYNRKRLHSTLGHRTPFEALTDHQRRAAA
jgi:hypothetical protein